MAPRQHITDAYMNRWGLRPPCSGDTPDGLVGEFSPREAWRFDDE